MKSLLRRVLSQNIYADSSRCENKSVKKKNDKPLNRNRSRGHLKRVRNAKYKKEHKNKGSWKTFPRNQKVFKKVENIQTTSEKTNSRPSNKLLIKLGKQIIQSRRALYESTPMKSLKTSVNSVLFTGKFHEFTKEIKELICS